MGFFGFTAESLCIPMHKELMETFLNSHHKSTESHGKPLSLGFPATKMGSGRKIPQKRAKTPIFIYITALFWATFHKTSGKPII